jgi:Fe-S cluster assembly iron-binding protein IscA
VLQITQGAAALLNDLRQGQEVPDDYGLRIFAEPSAAGEMTIGLGFTDRPAEGDQVSEQGGLQVYVAPELAQPLDNAAIDVAQEDGAERLVFRPQGTDTAASS